MRDGVGRVLENLSDVAVIPVALVSDSEDSKNVPDNLRIAFGEPVLTMAGMTGPEYTSVIDEKLNHAARSVGG